MLSEQNRELQNSQVGSGVAESQLLPQTYCHKTARTDLRQEYLTERMMEIQSQVKEAAIRAYRSKGQNLSDQDLEFSPLVDRNGKVVSERKSIGFRLIDNRQLDPKNWDNAIPELDRVDLVSVELRKKPGQRDTIIPIVHAHVHPMGIGETIKHDIDRATLERFGDSPEQLIRSKYSRGFESCQNFLKQKSRILVALAALAGVGYVGAEYGPVWVQQYTTYRHNRANEIDQQRMAESREAVANIEQAEKTNSGFNQEVCKSLLKKLSSDHYETLEKRLNNPEKTTRMETVSLLARLGRYEIYSESENTSNIPEKAREYFEGAFSNFIKSEKDQDLRYMAADALHTVHVTEAGHLGPVHLSANPGNSAK